MPEGSLVVRKLVLSLCDLTGNAVHPWADAERAEAMIASDAMAASRKVSE